MLTFEGLTSNTTAVIPNGYGGLNWNNMSVAYGFIIDQNSGFNKGRVSGDYVAFNQLGNVGSVTGGIFTFNSAFFTAGWRDSLSITIDGMNNGSQIYSQTIMVDHDTPALVTFNWTGIDELTFTSFRGTVVDGISGNGTNFVMDNFTFDEAVTNVPEPTSMALLSLATAAGLGLRLRQRRLEATRQEPSSNLLL